MEPPAGRRYPLQPIVGVGAVIVTPEGDVVLVRRRHDPLAGRWSLPGGALELGEGIREAVAREVQEETGFLVDVGPIVDVVDHVSIDDDGRTEYHFVIADYLCRPSGGWPHAGSDVDAVAIVSPVDVEAYDLTATALAVVRRGLELYTLWGTHQ